jgi:putative holliday junction resolvase
MARIMALDVGEKTIGVAMSDESETFAFPGKTILRHEGFRKDMNVVRQLVEQNQVTEVVVGLPLLMDGSHGIQAGKVEEFAKTLRRFVRVPVVFEDERLSTFEAEEMLIAAGRKWQERKKVIDSAAASVILQSYLDRRKRPAT